MCGTCSSENINTNVIQECDDKQTDVRTYIYIYTGCPTTYQTRQFFNNFTTNEDIATKFEAEWGMSIGCQLDDEELSVAYFQQDGAAIQCTEFFFSPSHSVHIAICTKCISCSVLVLNYCLTVFIRESSVDISGYLSWPLQCKFTMSVLYFS